MFNYRISMASSYGCYKEHTLRRELQRQFKEIVCADLLLNHYVVQGIKHVYILLLRHVYVRTYSLLVFVTVISLEHQHNFREWEKSSLH